jgi:hypothetical protein
MLDPKMFLLLAVGTLLLLAGITHARARRLRGSEDTHS